MKIKNVDLATNWNKSLSWSSKMTKIEIEVEIFKKKLKITLLKRNLELNWKNENIKIKGNSKY